MDRETLRLLIEEILAERGQRAAATRPAVGGVNEKDAAAALGVSVSYMRKDRYGKKSIPYFMLGGRVRYDLDRIRAGFALREVNVGEERCDDDTRRDIEAMDWLHQRGLIPRSTYHQIKARMKGRP